MSKKRPKIAKWEDDEVFLIDRKLGRESAWGMYWDDGLIEIDGSKPQQDVLLALFHEFSHRLLDTLPDFEMTWEEQDKYISEVESDFVKYCTALGFRRIPDL